MTPGVPSDWRPVFPAEINGEGIVLRMPVHDDVSILATAFGDPVLSREAGLPPLGEKQLHAALDEQFPQWRATGQLVPYVII
jgi:hypothetical protein